MDDYEDFAVAHVDRLLRLARVLTGDPHEAEDLTQEALGLTLRKWQQVRAASNQLAYARRLLVNLHYSRVRRRSVATVPLEALSFEPAAAGPTSYEDRDALRAAVSTLPPRQRTALVLRFYEDLDIHEVAEVMGINEASVRSALARGLSTLRSTDVQEAHHD